MDKNLALLNGENKTFIKLTPMVVRSEALLNLQTK